MAASGLAGSLLGIFSGGTSATAITNITNAPSGMMQPGQYRAVHGGGLSGLGSTLGGHFNIPYPQPPYTNIEILNVLECSSNDDATEKLGAFRKMIPPEQDLMLFGKWIFVLKKQAVHAGMAVQLIIPLDQVNAIP